MKTQRNLIYIYSIGSLLMLFALMKFIITVNNGIGHYNEETKFSANVGLSILTGLFVSFIIGLAVSIPTYYEKKHEILKDITTDFVQLSGILNKCVYCTTYADYKYNIEIISEFLNRCKICQNNSKSIGFIIPSSKDRLQLNIKIDRLNYIETLLLAYESKDYLEVTKFSGYMHILNSILFDEDGHNRLCFELLLMCTYQYFSNHKIFKSHYYKHIEASKVDTFMTDENIIKMIRLLQSKNVSGTVILNQSELIQYTCKYLVTTGIMSGKLKTFGTYVIISVDGTLLECYINYIDSFEHKMYNKLKKHV